MKSRLTLLCATAPLLSSLCSGFLQQQQQQHPVRRVGVSASPRLVQIPSTRPFLPHSQIFPPPRAFPACLRPAPPAGRPIRPARSPGNADEELRRRCSPSWGLFLPQQGTASPWGRDSHPKGITSPSPGCGCHTEGQGALEPLAELCLFSSPSPVASIGVREIQIFNPTKSFLLLPANIQGKGGRGDGRGTLGSQILQLSPAKARREGWAGVSAHIAQGNC